MIRIFTACLDYITCFPSDILISDTKELTLMKMRCHFIVAAAQVALARTTSQTEEQLQRYQETRQHAIVLYKHSVTEVSQDEHVIQDLHAKLATMAVFEFEAAVVLNRWDDLGRIVRGASLPGDEAILKAMGDCLLRSQTPGQGKIQS